MGRIEDDTTPWGHGEPPRERGDDLGDDPGQGAGLQPGSRVDEYTVREHIATGGFGSVYRAEHTRLGRTVALKVLHAELADSPELIARFEREARAVNLIRHSNVVDIFDFGQLVDRSYRRPYFVMEYLTGQSLGDHVAERGPLSPGDCAAILEPLCAALGAAHAHQIVHRDVTPSNVFIEQKGGQRRVVLLDFGIAKLLGQDVERLTSVRQRIGTPTWMAPEQLLTGDVDARSDIYTVGALTYYMLTRHVPFGDEPPELMLELHSHGRRPRPSDVVDVPRAIDDVVVRAMAVEPTARFATVDDFFRAFDSARRTAAGAGQRAAGSGHAVGIHVELRVDPDELEIADEDLLADMDDALVAADHLLRDRGLVAAAETGSSLFFVLPMSSASDIETRRRAIEIADQLHRVVGAPVVRDHRVAMRITLHVDAVIIAAGKVRGGPLTRLSRWTTESDPAGVVATDAVIAPLESGESGEPFEALPGGRYCLARTVAPGGTATRPASSNDSSPGPPVGARRRTSDVP